MKLFTVFSFLLIQILSGFDTFGQSALKINWITFSQLNDSLKTNSKKVFVDFYADWCTYCREMERTTFTDEKVINILNNDYYAIKMNVESRDSILFGGQTFINKRTKKPNPVHDIALLMASRKDLPFSLPAFVLLNDEFSATARYFQFLDANSMVDILRKQEKLANN